MTQINLWINEGCDIFWETAEINSVVEPNVLSE
jgi:hypothetical protein